MTLKALASGSVHYLYDPDLFDDFSPDLFTVRHAQTEIDHGRGNAVVFEYQDLQLIKRHYLRGGWVRHLVHDTYAFRSLANTRMWREAQITTELFQRGLPVPKFVAARCEVTAGIRYSGDLVTLLIPESQTLVQWLKAAPMTQARWQKLGATLARFHAEGLCHADLNANNVLISRDGSVHVIDFDKAVFMPAPGKWQQTNLARLLRSLHKQKHLYPELQFTDQNWLWLLSAYAGRAR